MTSQIRWRLITGAVLCAGFLLAGSPAPQKSERPEVMLEAANKRELIDGDLKGAIAQYQKILNTRGISRAVAAKALLHLGQCQEKLGDAEARKAYERLVMEFADQAEPARAARVRLAALASPSPTTLTVRRLENSPADVVGAPSPDGRYLSFVKWNSGDLTVRDLQTGKDRRLTTEGTLGGDDAAHFPPVLQEAEYSTWSPDSRQLAYVWYFGNRMTDLRVVGLDGGKPRVLSHHENGERLECRDWSPDGKQILAVLQPAAGQPQVVLVSVADGSRRVLRPGGGEDVRFSPDGRFVVYSARPDEAGPERDVFLLSVNTGQVTPLIQHPADDFLLGWSADGKWIAFASDRTGAIGLWIVGVADGRTQGAPRLVKAGIGRVLPMGLTREGALYYGVVTATEDVYVADLDPKTGNVIGSPRKAIEHHEGGNYSPSYSPDGEYMAYVSKRGSDPYPTGFGNTLCIRSLKTGQEREFYREIWRLGLRSIRGFRWTSDSRFITFGGTGTTSAISEYRIDLKTSEITRIFQYGADDELLNKVSSDDGRYSFDALGDRNSNTSRIVVRDLNSGEQRELYRFPRLERFITLALSPDGQWLSFMNAGWGGVRSLRIIPVSGGDAREVWSFETRGGMPGGNQIWTPDGRFILFCVPSPNDLMLRELWRVPAEGGKPEKIGLDHRWGINSLTVHPGGRQIAFSGRGGHLTDNEVWVVENFLPEPTATK
jgi:Tol biopolymer transport system component